MRREYLSPSDNGAQGRGTGLSKSTVFGDDDDTRAGLDFLDALCVELTSHFGLKAPNPYLSIAINLVRGHLDARPATQTSLIAGAGVPYATAIRRLHNMDSLGLLEHRTHSRSGKRFSIHPSEKLIEAVAELTDRVRMLSVRHFGDDTRVRAAGRSAADARDV
jgi:hypothetical protein